MIRSKYILIACLGWLALFFLAAGSTLAQTPPPQTGSFVPGEVVVKFRPTVNAQQRQSALTATGLRPLAASPYSGVLRVQVPPGQEAATIASLQARGDVEFAEVNAIVTAFDSPNDPDFSKQWGLHNSGQSGGITDADIDGPAAWDLETGSSEVIVAILDSGIDLDHPDLQPHLWINSDEIPGNDVDDDNNGFIDDVNGWNFCIFSTCSLQDNFPDDPIGHGSHVAGVAAAVGDNGQGVTGVSRKATLMPVKVLHSTLSGTATSIANGIDYAVANGAQVINLSLGASTTATTYPCPSFTVIQQAMQNALANGVLVVAASGNDNDLVNVSCPAAFDEALAVGATDHNDDRWEWSASSGSNGGSRLDVVAPGGSDTEANKNVNGIYSTSINGSYRYDSGTSMSAPHVTGLAALLLAFDPTLTPGELRALIEATVDDLAPAGFDAAFGHGRVNAGQALATLASLQSAPAQTHFASSDPNGPIPTASTIQLTTTSSGSITWTVTISPAVAWLAVSPATGTISASTSPQTLTLTPTQPLTYGVYSTTVLIAGTDSVGLSLGRRQTVVTLNYLQAQLYLPLILK